MTHQRIITPKTRSVHAVSNYNYEVVLLFMKNLTNLN